MKLLKKPHSPRRVLIQCIAVALALGAMLAGGAWLAVQKVRAVPEYASSAGVLHVEGVFVSPRGRAYAVVRRSYQNPFLQSFDEMELASMQLEAADSQLTATAWVEGAPFTASSAGYPTFYSGQNGVFHTYYTLAFKEQLPPGATEVQLAIDGHRQKPFALQRLQTRQAVNKSWQLPDGAVQVSAWSLSDERREILVYCQSDSAAELPSPSLSRVQLGGEDTSRQAVYEQVLESGPDYTLVLYRQQLKKTSRAPFEHYPEIGDLVYQGLEFSYYLDPPAQIEFPILREQGRQVSLERQLDLSPTLSATGLGAVRNEQGFFFTLHLPALSEHLSLCTLEYRAPGKKSTEKLDFSDPLLDLHQSDVAISCAVERDKETSIIEIHRLSYFYPVIGWAFRPDT